MGRLLGQGGDAMRRDTASRVHAYRREGQKNEGLLYSPAKDH